MASSVLALAVIAALAVKGPYRGLWLFLATTPFGAAAAFNMPALGGASILVGDLAAVAMFGLVMLHRDGPRMIAGSMRVGQPGFWLLLLTIFAVFATLFFPRVFQGATEVFSLTRDIGKRGIVEVPLRPSTGNLTQLFRLMLGVAIFYALATVFRLRPDARLVLQAVTITTVVNVALGWIDVLSYEVGLPNLLDVIRSANYAMLDAAYMSGLKRMVGGFPEASSYGYYSLGLFAFWLRYWLSSAPSRLTTAMLALSAFSVLRSTSSASYVALVGYLGVVALLALAANLNGRVERRGLAIAFASVLLICATILALVFSYQFIPAVQQYFDVVLFKKLASDSGVERMGWNAQAFRNFLDTWMMGAGLGSVRASSWLMATLGSIGIIGTFLFLRFILGVLRPADGRGGYGPQTAVIAGLRSACLGLVISSLLTGATPDLGLIFFAFCGLSAGLSRGAILARQRGAERHVARSPDRGNNPRGWPILLPEAEPK